MMRLHLTRLVGVLALAGALGLVQGGQRAEAAYMVCRTDPLITLSNGAVVDLSAVTVSSQPQITHASYAVHVPVGVHVTGIKYDASASIEAVAIVADQAAHHYRFDLVASTVAPTAVYEYATMSKVVRMSAGPAGSIISVTMTGP